MQPAGRSLPMCVLSPTTGWLHAVVVSNVQTLTKAMIHTCVRTCTWTAVAKVHWLVLLPSCSAPVIRIDLRTGVSCTIQSCIHPLVILVSTNYISLVVIDVQSQYPLHEPCPWKIVHSYISAYPNCNILAIQSSCCAEVFWKALSVTRNWEENYTLIYCTSIMYQPLHMNNYMYARCPTT